MKSPVTLVSCLLCLTASCLSYKASRIEVDAPIEVEAFDTVQVGETTMAQAVGRMGPPDFFSFRWDECGERFLRLEYGHSKGRHTDFSIGAPVDEISRYNTGVRFFLLFFRVMRGGSVIPSELSEFESDQMTAADAVDSSVRYSRIKPSHRGRPQRLSTLPRLERREGSIEGGPLSPFVPLAMKGSGRGVGRIRLEFDAEGTLVLKEIRSTVPGTSLADYFEETILQ
ncbi:MAG: hypothetical protein ACYTG7_05865 [Planctomycetota bacterium]|jgi:hypothetical protein